MHMKLRVELGVMVGLGVGLSLLSTWLNSSLVESLGIGANSQHQLIARKRLKCEATKRIVYITP